MGLLKWFKKGKGIEAAAADVAGGVVTKIIDSASSFGKGHLGKKELQLELSENRLELETIVAKSLAAESEAFRSFFLAYEGAAADQKPFVQILRGLVRPVITLYLVGAWSWLAYRYLSIDLAKVESLMLLMRQLFFLNLVTLSFWFGDKMIQRTGLLDIFKKDKSNGH